MPCKHILYSGNTRRIDATHPPERAERAEGAEGAEGVEGAEGAYPLPINRMSLSVLSPSAPNPSPVRQPPCIIHASPRRPSPTRCSEPPPLTVSFPRSRPPVKIHSVRPSKKRSDRTPFALELVFGKSKKTKSTRRIDVKRPRHPPPVPWTLNVYSARALCFLAFFPKTWDCVLVWRFNVEVVLRSDRYLTKEATKKEGWTE